MRQTGPSRNKWRRTQRLINNLFIVCQIHCGTLPNYLFPHIFATLVTPAAWYRLLIVNITVGKRSFSQISCPIYSFMSKQLIGKGMWISHNALYVFYTVIFMLIYLISLLLDTCWASEWGQGRRGGWLWQRRHFLSQGDLCLSQCRFYLFYFTLRLHRHISKTEGHIYLYHKV